MGKYLLALDQGTTSSRAIIFNKNGEIVGKAQQEFEQLYTGDGYVEHRPEDILNGQIAVMKTVLKECNISAEEIDCIGIANQRETTLVWDKNTGTPIYNAIVWQCRRTAKYCAQMLKKHGKSIYKRTGLKVDAYFSASKINWILNRVAGAKERAVKGELLFGTVDSYLLWNLTANRAHYTDYTNASRTMLYNIHSLEWDDYLLKLFDIPKCMLPKVKPSGYNYGVLDKDILGVEIPICAMVGDQQSALYGQMCWDKGNCKNTYGTGCFMLMNTGDKAVKSKNGLLTTLGATVKDKPPYLLEGSVFIGGATVQWLRDGLKVVNSASQTEEMAMDADKNDNVYFVPAFVGLGAPHWNSDARGCISGLTRATTQKEIVRAGLEGIAYQVADVMQAMEKDLGEKPLCLRVDGGASANSYLMQFQADILGIPVVRPHTVETTALGAVYLAGLVNGYYKGLEDVSLNSSKDEQFNVKMPNEIRNKKIAGWKKAVERATI